MNVKRIPIAIQMGYNRQRGFGLLEVAIYAACFVAVCGAIYGVFRFVDAHWETQAGINKGANDITALYAKRDNKALTEANAARTRLEARVAELEADATGKVTAADAAYQKGLTDGKAKVDSAVDAVHAGYRLRDPGGTSSCTNQSGGGTALAATGNPGVRDGQAAGDVPRSAGCSLSEGKSEFLIRLAGEADDTAKQLGACQVILQDVYDYALQLGDAMSGGQNARPTD